MSELVEETKKPITLYTGVTANGHQISILLEELKAVNPIIDCNIFAIDISAMVQKEPWFIKLNPNGRIPVLVDHSRSDFKVFESSAILLYLAQHYDKDHVFWFDPKKDPDNYSEMLQWIFFTHGRDKPFTSYTMRRMIFHMRRSASDHNHSHHEQLIDIIQIGYTDETRRLLGVLEMRLKYRDWIAGSGRGKFSLADIKAFPWVRAYKFTGVESIDPWPSVKTWIARCEERKGVQSGLQLVKYE